MASLAAMTPAIRQPFGILDDTKIRSLQSVKNRQNALYSSPAAGTGMKRRHATPDNTSDSENVDPNVLKSPSKRKRIGGHEEVSKTSLYSLTTIPNAKPRVPALSNSGPRTASHTTKSSIITQKPVPVPAPAAGRSPTRANRQGILSRHRASSNAPFRRVDPLSYGPKRHTLSIAAALQGTIAHKKAKQVLAVQEFKPKGWFFDIYEETQGQQEYVMNEWSMTQSARILEISDDEEKAKHGDDRGKENVPPFEVPVASAPSIETSLPNKIATSRKDMMTDEQRTPLGDLNPSDYYAEGCDATSVVLVHEDAERETESEANTDTTIAPGTSTTLARGAESGVESEGKLNQAELGALLAISAPTKLDQTQICQDENDKAETEAGDIEIWESESAKEEDEENVENSIFAV